MRLPRLRLRLRGALLAIAVIALLTASARVWVRWRAPVFASYAIWYADAERSYLREASFAEFVAANPGALGLKPQDAKAKIAEAKGCRAMAAYYAALKRKYEFATSYPLLLVAPDPPPPEP